MGVPLTARSAGVAKAVRAKSLTGLRVNRALVARSGLGREVLLQSPDVRALGLEGRGTFAQTNLGAARLTGVRVGSSDALARLGSGRGLIGASSFVSPLRTVFSRALARAEAAHAVRDPFPVAIPGVLLGVGLFVSPLQFVMGFFSSLVAEVELWLSERKPRELAPYEAVEARVQQMKQRFDEIAQINIGLAGQGFKDDELPLSQSRLMRAQELCAELEGIFADISGDQIKSPRVQTRIVELQRILAFAEAHIGMDDIPLPTSYGTLENLRSVGRVHSFGALGRLRWLASYMRLLATHVFARMEHVDKLHERWNLLSKAYYALKREVESVHDLAIRQSPANPLLVLAQIRLRSSRVGLDGLLDPHSYLDPAKIQLFHSRLVQMQQGVEDVFVLLRFKDVSEANFLSQHHIWNERTVTAAYEFVLIQAGDEQQVIVFHADNDDQKAGLFESLGRDLLAAGSLKVIPSKYGGVDLMFRLDPSVGTLRKTDPSWGLNTGNRLRGFVGDLPARDGNPGNVIVNTFLPNPAD